MNEAPARKRSLLSLGIRVAIGVGVLAFVALRHPAELGDVLSRARASDVIAAALLIFGGIFIGALRWRAYLEALEISISPGTLFRLYFVGIFFNAFLPTGIGGDAYKAVRLGRARSGGALAFASVFLDRFAGLVALALIGLVGVLGELAVGDPDLRVAGVSLALSGGILVGALVLLLAGDRLIARFIPERGWGTSIRRSMRGIHEAGRHPAAAARGYVLGIAFQSIVLVEHLLLARALGIDSVSIGAMASITVVSQMATMIPLTVNGLGFREGAYVWALGTFGVARPQARAFAVLVLAIMLATSLAGGLAYVVRGGDVPTET